MCAFSRKISVEIQPNVRLLIFLMLKLMRLISLIKHNSNQIKELLDLDYKTPLGHKMAAKMDGKSFVQILQILQSQSSKSEKLSEFVFILLGATLHIAHSAGN